MNELPAGELQTPEQDQSTEEVSLSDAFEKALESVQREAREVALMLEQSQAEVNRLGQKSASVIAYVKQMRERQNWEEMASACETALDAQQRYLIMRGQLEKLQHVYETLGRFEETLQRLQAAATQKETTSAVSSGQKSTLATLEMLIQAQESERQRLSRQMHDGPAQTLSNFILQTEIAARLFEVDPDRARKELQNLKTSAASTFQQVREFIFELRPMMLDDLGLAPTIKRYLESLNNQTNATIDLKLLGQEQRYAGYVEIFVFRAIQELISAALHERKATQVQVTMELEPNSVKVQIEDDGTPIKFDALSEDSTGLRLLRERIEMMGGHMNVERNPGGNNTITFVVQAQANTR